MTEAEILSTADFLAMSGRCDWEPVVFALRGLHHHVTGVELSRPWLSARVLSPIPGAYLHLRVSLGGRTMVEAIQALREMVARELEKHEPIDRRIESERVKYMAAKGNRPDRCHLGREEWAAFKRFLSTQQMFAVGQTPSQTVRATTTYIGMEVSQNDKPGIHVFLAEEPRMAGFRADYMIHDELHPPPIRVKAGAKLRDFKLST